MLKKQLDPHVRVGQESSYAQEDIKVSIKQETMTDPLLYSGKLAYILV